MRGLRLAARNGRALGRVALGVGLLAAVSGGCQILAGVGDLAAHGPEGQGGSTGSHLNVTHASGAVGGGGNGSGGQTCTPDKNAPSCTFLTAFGSASSTPVLKGADVSEDNVAVMTGLAGHMSPFGICGNNDTGCVFFQSVSGSGAPLRKGMLQGMGPTIVRDVAFVPGTGVLAFSAEMSSVATLTLPDEQHVGQPLGGQGHPGFVAAIEETLDAVPWFAAFETSATPQTQQQFHVGAASDGTITASATVLTDGSEVVWGACRFTPAAGLGEENVLARFLSDGTCMEAVAFGGLGTQSIDVLRVSPAGKMLIAGIYDSKGISLPGTTTLAAQPKGSNAYVALIPDLKGGTQWAFGFGGNAAMLFLGGGFSPAETHVAVTGAFIGSQPVGIADKPHFSNCDGTSAAPGQGFVFTYVEKDGFSEPTPDIALCLGDSGETTIYDAAVDEDGSVTLAGITGGSVTFGRFHAAAGDAGVSASFALKIDREGNLLRATSEKSIPRGYLTRTVRRASQLYAFGSFVSDVDFGCKCQASSQPGGDVFVAELGF